MAYKNSSPWNNTKIVNDNYLGILNIRPIPAKLDDVLFTITPQYTHRPDLLAYDLYDNPKLWWVFAQRNMDVLKDPIFDFEAGLQIFLPRGSALSSSLGL